MPGKHVPPRPISVANDIIRAVPPTNGCFLEFGYTDKLRVGDGIRVGYRGYISGDTLFVDELKEIPRHLNDNYLDVCFCILVEQQFEALLLRCSW
jgi:hypothetical protein